ncbi:MAG TPA: hypothetical protein VMV08_11170 [Gaiellaceae bacterium]|nr:hypothetical protein [Gaiellaceae bacterium]
MSLFRREKEPSTVVPPSISAKRAHPGLLRRERRALLSTREEKLRDLGGLTVEMYRRSSWRDDLLHERCAEVIGIDARLAEIDELLHGSEGTDRCRCGAPVLRGSHFCPNCGRLLDVDVDVDPGTRVISEDTVVAPPPPADDDE